MSQSSVTSCAKLPGYYTYLLPHLHRRHASQDFLSTTQTLMLTMPDECAGIGCTRMSGL